VTDPSSSSWPSSPEKARDIIAALEASTAHMRGSGDRALLGVIAWNERRVAALRDYLGEVENVDPHP